ncbi:MAG: Uma2 family endonuclease [Chloroflexia bacterium]
MQNLERVRGRSTFDLQGGPPPDLVVEIETSRSAVDKLDLFAAFGVPEVWRYDGARLEIRVLEVGGYLPAAESRVLPGATAEALTALLAEGRESQFVVPLRRMREWARGFLEEVGK